MINFDNFSGTNSMTGLIKGMVPLAVKKLQEKIEEQESKNGGKLLYMIFNEQVNGVLTTLISVYSFKNSPQGEEIEKINLKDYITNDGLMEMVLSNADAMLGSLGPFAAVLKTQLAAMDADVLSSFLDQITVYLDDKSKVYGGLASIHLQVVKKRTVVQVLSHQGYSLQGKATQKEIATLENFAQELIDTFAD